MLFTLGICVGIIGIGTHAEARGELPICAVGGVGGLCPLGSWSTATTKAGWTVGIGAEGPVGGNWSWKAEYLFVDLGNINTAFPTGLGNFGSTSAIIGLSAGTGTISSRITDNIVRVGLNYQFH